MATNSGSTTMPPAKLKPFSTGSENVMWKPATKPTSNGKPMIRASPVQKAGKLLSRQLLAAMRPARTKKVAMSPTTKAAGMIQKPGCRIGAGM